MPAPVVSGVGQFLAQELNVQWWDGEVPRQDTSGKPISPAAGTPQWPVVRVRMDRGGFARRWTTEDPYSDDGSLVVEVWTTSRAALEAPDVGLLNRAEALFAQASNWRRVELPGGPPDNPYELISMLLVRWYSGQEEGARTADGQLLYRGELHYQVDVHGAVSTA